MSRWFGAAVLLLLSCTVCAVDQIQLQWGLIEAAGWRLERVNLVLDWSSGRPVLSVEAERFASGDQRVENLQLTCSNFDWLSNEVDCRHGRLTFSSDWIEAGSVPAAFNYRFDTGQLVLSVSGLPLAGGKAQLVFRYQQDGWRLDTTLEKNRLAGLARLLKKAGTRLPELGFQGTVSGKLGASGDSRGLAAIEWDLRTADCGYADAEGNQAAEALELSSRGKARPQGRDWLINASLSAKQGMLYSEPVYLEFSQQHPLDLSADLHWKASQGLLLLKSLAFNQPGVVSGRLDARLKPAADKPLLKGSLEITQASFPGFYETWLQPFFTGTALERLETKGRLGGRLTWGDGRPQAMQLQLEQLSFKDVEGSFGMQALDAELHWDNSETVLDSRLAWDSANVYRLKFGAAEVGIATGRNSLKLQEPLIVSLLDGELHVNEFELGLDKGEMRWLLDGLLTPVSMQAFSTALDWPPLAGKLSGMIPKVRYEKGELTLGGILLVQAFDGDITLRNLRIQQPLGLVPRLWADARLENIDLKTLTRTFSFGRIEGRLEGEVRDLYMEAWQLVAFDSYLRTPRGDKSRRRISQKAVDNISDIGGGGVGGAVSRSFLRFLEDFPYKRLGISCRLENGVCHMGGVAPAERGYYLVQGRLIPPRLDVIGFASEVDWNSLVDRLVSVTEGELPTVQ